jgi:TMEM164 family
MCDAGELALISATRQFSAYGPSHWAVLAVFAIGSAGLVWIGRRQTEPQSRLLSRVLGPATAAVYGAVVVHKLLQPTIADSVPLNLTDLATVTAAYALWSQRHWAFALTYYWGLVLSTQALITPVLHAPDFPHYRFLAFFTIHLLVVWAAIYLTWGRGSGRGGAATASRLSRPWHGRQSPSRSTESREQTMAFSTESPPPRRCWTYSDHGRSTY